MLSPRLISVLVALAFCVLSNAQNRVAADVEIKSMMDGKVTTVTKRVFCQAGGRVVTVFNYPARSVTVSNLSGELTVYSPASNEVYSTRSDDYSTRDELLYIFLSGRSSDLGLSAFGYLMESSVPEEDGIVKRTFRTSRKGDVPVVVVVLKDFLPIYAEYRDLAGKVLSKSYFSGYDYASRFVFPSRVTAIDYVKDGKDSTVTRTLYTNLAVGSQEPEFDFKVPSGAIPSKNPLLK